ncbi:pentatricopeptide repeat-containing protein [Tripterygium wilfordii]|uniref:Pentatricopeptide repeat-containing protein n=1 Tax=Tripterygium wilfordii TaxID=458696 RepID=A0A7J7CLR8_TRIWF|nr:pentatricopeptide repeat-containing protein [Tripterygium wilfordii]
MMIRTPVFHQTHLLNPPQSLDFNMKLKEQESLSLLRRCKNMKEFNQVHVQILKLGLFWDSICASNLLATCALSDWGSMDSACSIFQRIDEPGTFDFNTMIRGYVKDLNMEEALFLYEEILERAIEPDNFTYPALLKACTWLQALKEGMQIHGHVHKLGFEDDMYVKNSLITMYGKCGDIELSSAVFEQIEQKNVISWSTIIAAHASLGMWLECLMLFRDMNDEGCCRPEESTLVSVLSACTHLGFLDQGRSTHGYLLRNIRELNVIVQTSLIDMYVKCGYLEKGMFLFQSMPEKNIRSYSVMISALAMQGYRREALRLFAEMLEKGLEPDDVVYVGVLSACSHAGLVTEGLQYFDRMKLEHGIEPTAQHYSCLVDLLGRAGMLSEALELIKNMQFEPNDVVWRTLLSACRAHHDIETAEIAAKNLFRLNSCNPSDYLTLSNIYARDQRWEDVSKIRTEMARKGIAQMPGFSMVEVKRKIYKEFTFAAITILLNKTKHRHNEL